MKALFLRMLRVGFGYFIQILSPSSTSSGSGSVYPHAEGHLVKCNDPVVQSTSGLWKLNHLCPKNTSDRPRLVTANFQISECPSIITRSARARPHSAVIYSEPETSSDATDFHSVPLEAIMHGNGFR